MDSELISLINSKFELLQWFIGGGAVFIAALMGFMWKNMNSRFEMVDRRFDKIDQRFAKLEEKVNSIDCRLARLEGAFSAKECCMISDSRHLRKAE